MTVSLILNKVRLFWTIDEVENHEDFEGFTFQGIKKQMENFMKEKNIDIDKNKCRTEVLK